MAFVMSSRRSRRDLTFGDEGWACQSLGSTPNRHRTDRSVPPAGGAGRQEPRGEKRHPPGSKTGERPLLKYVASLDPQEQGPLKSSLAQSLCNPQPGYSFCVAQNATYPGLCLTSPWRCTSVSPQRGKFTDHCKLNSRVMSKLRLQQPFRRRGQPRRASAAEQGIQTRLCFSEASPVTTSTASTSPECPMFTPGLGTSWRAPGPAHTRAHAHPYQTCLSRQSISVPAELRATAFRSTPPVPHIEISDAASLRFSMRSTPPWRADSCAAYLGDHRCPVVRPLMYLQPRLTASLGLQLSTPPATASSHSQPARKCVSAPLRSAQAGPAWLGFALALLSPTTTTDTV
ncbi:hypothetical protein NDU88_003382 [Pleurodeles waltl]|uniref:Uncharacterized protein n=1 Tax=Pleurodeles waltl TaxID=8319 RepID=A0AAV7KYA8_PLEWA|nr:hypothetical protein NDU88_003382 [Pleurodeles waltl]